MPRRSLRQRLNDCEIMTDSAVNDEYDIVHFSLLAETEPVSFEEAIKNSKWLGAMKDEIRSIEKNNTSELCTNPKGRR